MSDPFGEAMDEAAEEQQSNDADDSIDLDQHYQDLNSDDNPKEKTVGTAVTEEMHAFYHELQDDEDVDIDPAQSIRDHLENLAGRHEETFERAMRKLEIDRKY